MKDLIFDYLVKETIDEAIALMVGEKDSDYNREGITREDYFPYGDKSYITMIHIKATRLRSLENNTVEKKLETIRDLINYATMYAAWLKKHCMGKHYVITSNKYNPMVREVKNDARP